MNIKCLILLCGVFLFSCKQKQEYGKQFHVLPFTNSVIDSEEVNILSYLYFYNGAGVAVADMVGDSLPDIYLVSNQGENRLLENQGNFNFEDVTEQAGVAGDADWQTGVAVVDINADGYNDIYVCSVSGIHGFSGENELYINNQDGTFTEQAEHYGLNFSDYSTAVAFFDYDLDGDLDLYLLNHAVHTEDGYRLPANQVRTMVSEAVGDRLLRNEAGVFTDVSEEAGVIRGKVGYGLAVKISDLNLDGWPDIYVSNDFHENDYIYMNQGDGSFAMATDQLFRYNTKYSMGNDVADVNSDGWPDVFVADMEPWEGAVIKTTQGEDSPEIFAYKLNYGYTRQYARNTLQINESGQRFYDVAQQYGVSSTDWSWSPLLEDFNQDGRMDLFVSNGILRRPNDLDFLNYISSETIKNQLNKGAEHDLEIIKEMPSGLLPNQFFLQGDKGFDFIGDHAGFTFSDQSTGTAIADFDGDGDLDLVMNRLNEPAIIWENEIAEGNSFQIKFDHPSRAYGSRVICYVGERMLVRELYPQRGFMSQSQSLLHFGLGESETVDSLVIYWNGFLKENINASGKKMLQLDVPKFEAPSNTAKPVSNIDLRQAYPQREFSQKPLLPFSGFDEMEFVELKQGDLQIKWRPFETVEVLNNDELIENNAPKGLWQTAAFFDKEGDGDLDVLLGNLGLNHRMKASQQQPMRLYIKDFDKNGATETIWAIYKDGAYYPLFSKDDITKQLVYLKKKYTDYQGFATQSMDDIFGEELKDAEVLEIESFENGWLIQDKGGFNWQPLPFELQQGPITSISIDGETCNVSGNLDIFAPYIGFLELPNYEWTDGTWTKN